MENTGNKKLIFEIIKALLFSVALMILFTIIQGIFEIFSMAIAVIYAIIQSMAGNPYYLSKPIMSFATGQDAIMLATLLCTLATAIVFLIWWISFTQRYNQLGRRFKAGAKFCVTHIHILIICAIIVYGFAELVVMGFALAAPEYVEQYEKIAEELVINNDFLNILTVVILAPIGEECLFRGLVLERLCRCMPAVVAIIIQAVLFGVLHGNLVQGCFVITLGLINGYVVCKKKSILPAIMIHAFQNGISLILEALPKNISGSEVFNLCFALLPILSVILLIGIFPRDDSGRLDFKF